MILLPPSRLAYLRSFSIALTLLNLSVVSILALCFRFGASLMFGSVLLVGLPLAGLFRPEVMKKPYAFWNSAAVLFSRVARLMLTATCFYIIFLIVGRAGSAIDLSTLVKTKSLWNQRRTLAPAEFAREFPLNKKIRTSAGWLGGFRSWAWNSGQLWALFLLPFLIMLSGLENSREPRLPDGLYTLF